MRPSGVRSGVLTWSLLAVLAAALLYKLAAPAPGAGTAATATVVAPAGAGVQPVPSGARSAPPIFSSLSASQTAPVPSPKASGASAGAFFGQPLTAWYQQALRPTATVHERTVATRLTVLCATVMSSRDTDADPRNARPRALPASVPGVSARELAEWKAQDQARSLQVRELQGLLADCQEGQGFNLISKLRAAGIRSTEYFDLALDSRPYANRLPVLTGVLANPRGHEVEFGVWVDSDLRSLLEDRDGLSMAQSWHARGWLLKEVLGNSEQLTLYGRTQCAWFSFCPGIEYLSDAERQEAEQAAKRALTDLRRQDWPRLIVKTRS